MNGIILVALDFRGTIDQADELQYVCDKCNILDDIDM